MNVSELKKFLDTLPNDMEIVYKCFSEQCILEVEEIKIEELCKKREDGWVQNQRGDMDKVKYLSLPGN